ncbi:MAG: hypothetical protein OXR72_06685 [Gemmatimonadota bacterium]|nr:hypothetical protein [Gemmatimonadota bacterium]
MDQVASTPRGLCQSVLNCLTNDNQDQSLFIGISVWVFIIGSVCDLTPDTPKPQIEVIQSITSIGLFSITVTFFFLGGAKMFLRQGFIEEGEQRRDQKMEAILKEDPHISGQELLKRVKEDKENKDSK